MTRILVTGTLHWPLPNVHVIEGALEFFKEHISAAYYAYEDRNVDEVTLVHGAARGVDLACAAAAQELGMVIEPHPAEWQRHGRAAGPIRNQLMVDTHPTVVLAFPHSQLKSIGTKDCILRAEAAGIPVLVNPVPPVRK